MSAFTDGWAKAIRLITRRRPCQRCDGTGLGPFLHDVALGMPVGSRVQTMDHTLPGGAPLRGTVTAAEGSMRRVEWDRHHGAEHKQNHPRVTIYCYGDGGMVIDPRATSEADPGPPEA
jgi:hypothetical protein